MAGPSTRNRQSGKGQAHTSTVHPTKSSGPEAYITCKIILFVSVIVLASSLLVSLPASTLSILQRKWLATPPDVWVGRREEVKDAFVSSWDAYTEHAWGMYTFFPCR
jgi:hypothetical protein